mgnify:CR=1 FL=1
MPATYRKSGRNCEEKRRHAGGESGVLRGKKIRPGPAIPGGVAERSRNRLSRRGGDVDEPFQRPVRCGREQKAHACVRNGRRPANEAQSGDAGGSKRLDRGRAGARRHGARRHCFGDGDPKPLSSFRAKRSGDPEPSGAREPEAVGSAGFGGRTTCDRRCFAAVAAPLGSGSPSRCASLRPE